MTQFYTAVVRFALLVCLCIPAFAEKYVKTAASGSGDGSSWANASSDLQAMINAAAVGESVWVAAGTYKPASHPTGCYDCNLPQDYTFQMRDVKLYGGFPATGNPTFADRDVNVHETILSGDLNGDDMITGTGNSVNFVNYTDNAFHVVLSIDETDNALLDGFTITGGNAYLDVYGAVYVEGQTVYQTEGGGLYANNSNLAVSNCKFIFNKAQYGGGISNRKATLTVSSSVLKQNFASVEGGGVCSTLAVKLVLKNCLISYNRSNSWAAAISSNRTEAEIRECIISENSCLNDGVVRCSQKPSSIVNTVVYGNQVSGSKIFDLFMTNAKIANCTITKNQMFYDGVNVVLWGSDSNVELRNTIVYDNPAYNGTRMTLNGNNTPFGAYNSIIENPTLSYTGSGNLGSMIPGFVDATDPDGLDNKPGSSDDGLRLQRTSPAVDAGTAANTPANDILGNAIYNLTRDIGAYEQLEGPDIYNGTEACQIITVNNVAGSQWYYFKHSNGLIAAINPTGLNLGTVTLEISDAPGVITYDSAPFLGRTMTIRSSRYGTGYLPSKYTVRFYYSDEELVQYNLASSGANGPEDLILAFRSGGSGCSLSTYGGNKAGMVSMSGMNSGEYGYNNYGFYLQASLSHFTIFAASADQDHPLPVDLVTFGGTAMPGFNLLEWETASEVNNAYFEIQKSADGRVFEASGERVAGAGTTNTVQKYTFRDIAPVAGLNYYRLNQVDHDGAARLSRIIAVDNPNAAISLYPNPVGKELFVKTTGRFHYRILDTAGVAWVQGKGFGSEPLSIGHLPAGVYFLLIGDTVHKFMKR